jgi:hypothetical protein
MTTGGAKPPPVVKELVIASTGKVVASTGTGAPVNSGNTGNYRHRVASTGILPKLRVASKIATTGNARNFASTGWRIEVTGGGKYWQWRRGSGKNRQSRYGGKFRDLSEARKEAYRKNVERRRRAANSSGEHQAGAESWVED